MSIHIAPLVVPIDRPATLVVSGLAPCAQYSIHVRARRQHDAGIERMLATDADGCLRVEGAYAQRGEYTIDVLNTMDVRDAGHVGRVFFYVAPPNLSTRRPLRCDLHIHTHYSDGDSSPAQMVVRGRELGLDVAVITDHDRYSPSLEASAAVERLGLNLITGPGEEVSGPNWHIVAINARAGITDLGRRTQKWGGDAAWEYETLRWAVLTTQEQGGRAYLAHPYWAIQRGYHLPSLMYDRVLEEGILDGVELLGDVRHENNLRSLARYLDFRADGHDIPIVGNSDTHGMEHTYGTYWTLVFVEEPTLNGVLEAIASGWSVACTTAGRSPDESAGSDCANGRAVRMLALGTFELVDYAYFLEHQFFPLHDRLCAQEAALVYRALEGNKLPEGAMAAYRAEMETLYAHCWDQQALA
jgi:predicted metal-dependent phosphoesterase TrpH